MNTVMDGPPPKLTQIAYYFIRNELSFFVELKESSECGSQKLKFSWLHHL